MKEPTPNSVLSDILDGLDRVDPVTLWRGATDWTVVLETGNLAEIELNLPEERDALDRIIEPAATARFSIEVWSL